MKDQIEKLRELLKKTKDESMKVSIEKRIKILEERQTVYKDEKADN